MPTGCISDSKEERFLALYLPESITLSYFRKQGSVPILYVAC